MPLPQLRWSASRRICGAADPLLPLCTFYSWHCELNLLECKLAGRAYFKEKCRRPDRALQQLELAIDGMTRFIVFLWQLATSLKCSSARRRLKL